MTQQRVLAATHTGEPYQPVRIYYSVPNKDVVLRAFSRIRCIDYDPRRQRWEWLYAHETRRLKFDTPYERIPSQVHPLVLGYVRFPVDSVLHLDARSLTRATNALRFFNETVGRAAMRPAKMRLINRLFEATERPGPADPDSHDLLFAEGKAGPTLSDLLEAKIHMATDHLPIEERWPVASRIIEGEGKKPFPEVEEFAFDQENPQWLKSLEVSLMMRGMAAMAAWLGRPPFDWNQMFLAMAQGQK